MRPRLHNSHDIIFFAVDLKIYVCRANGGKSKDHCPESCQTESRYGRANENTCCVDQNTTLAWQRHRSSMPSPNCPFFEYGREQSQAPSQLASGRNDNNNFHSFHFKPFSSGTAFSAIILWTNDNAYCVRHSAAFKRLAIVRIGGLSSIRAVERDGLAQSLCQRGEQFVFCSFLRVDPGALLHPADPPVINVFYQSSISIFSNVQTIQERRPSVNSISSRSSAQMPRMEIVVQWASPTT